ncbi:MAG TPA: DUF202 domain-containing protein [Edaphobacter sp.]|nr:DUF202 domain-containing protein [Edaphobacter sp.]
MTDEITASGTAIPNSTQLAVDRTWLAHERTLMAWVRTAVSMISFAFTIYKFFQFEQGRGAIVNEGFFSPRKFALVLVSVALIALVAATISHYQNTRVLASQLKRRSTAVFVAFVVCFFGLAVLITAIVRG